MTDLKGSVELCEPVTILAIVLMAALVIFAIVQAIRSRKK